MSDNVKVSQRYRELGAEEPPRALDEAILAAARREAGAGPMALSARSGRQRWYAPLATAAVLVLAVAVTLNMQLERPGIESPAAKPAVPAVEADLKLKIETQVAATKQPVKEMTATPRKEAAKLAPAVPAAREPQPFAADQAAASVGPASARSDNSRSAESSVTGALARQMEERTSRDAEAGARAPRLGPIQAQAAPQAAPQVQKQADTPERELERIAELRVQGRHDEADTALAEFRKRYPEYRIADAMRERVERR